MTLIHATRDLPPGRRGVCLAIGVFDGVHLGHQQVIRQMVTAAQQQEARSIVITFDRHPNTVVAPERVPPLVYSLPQKLRAIAALGVDSTLVIHFDEPFSRQSGEDFIRGLARDFGHIRSVCVGANFTFGHRRSGNVAVLDTLGQELNFIVHGLAAVSLDGQVVSSTRVRESLRAGQLDFAAQLLGRGYSLAGPVVRGEGLGRRLGFPTANIDTTGLVLPPTGVYAIHAQVRPAASHLVENAPPLPSLAEEGGQKSLVQPSGTGPDAALSPRIYRAALNIGYRPTLPSQTLQPQVEAHLFDFTGDIYGQEMEITFVEKLRDEQKFPSLEALQRQIALDIATAKKLFTNRGHPSTSAAT